VSLLHVRTNRIEREQCKVAVFHFTRKLSDPDPNASVVISTDSFDTDKRTSPGARSWGCARVL